MRKILDRACCQALPEDDIRERSTFRSLARPGRSLTVEYTKRALRNEDPCRDNRHNPKNAVKALHNIRS